MTHKIIDNQFLRDFAEKFGKDEADRENIQKCDEFYVDYYDGVGALYFKSFYEDKWEYHFSIGNNGNIFECEDYRFLLDNLISKNEDFIKWLNDHKLTEEDLMSISGEFYDNGEDFHTDFSFYNRSMMRRIK